MKQYKVDVLKTGINLGESYKYSYKTKNLSKYLSKKINDAINRQEIQGGKIEIKKSFNKMEIDFSEVSGSEILKISYEWNKEYVKFLNDNNIKI